MSTSNNIYSKDINKFTNQRNIASNNNINATSLQTQTQQRQQQQQYGKSNFATSTTNVSATPNNSTLNNNMNPFIAAATAPSTLESIKNEQVGVAAASSSSGRIPTTSVPTTLTKLYATAKSGISLSSPSSSSVTKKKQSQPINKSVTTTYQQRQQQHQQKPVILDSTKQKLKNATTTAQDTITKKSGNNPHSSSITSSQNPKQKTQQKSDAATTQTSNNKKNNNSLKNTDTTATNTIGINKLIDTTIIKMVQDILTLLQTYGPLTYDQLEYNLPPYNNCSYGIQDVLNILIVIKIVRLVKERFKEEKDIKGSDIPKSDANDSSHQQEGKEESKAEDKIDQDEPQKKEDEGHKERKEDNNIATTSNVRTIGEVKYAFLDGNALPRIDSITPIHHIFYLLESARCEINDSTKRIAMLREDLKQTAKSKKTTSTGTSSSSSGRKRKYFPKDILQRILTLFPNLLSDPVYSMAFRNCHVDRSIVMTGPNSSMSTSTNLELKQNILPSKVMSSSGSSILGTPPAKKKMKRNSSSVSTSSATPTVALSVAATSSSVQSSHNALPGQSKGTVASSNAVASAVAGIKITPTTQNVVRTAQGNNNPLVTSNLKKDVILTNNNTVK